jgi:hypothetical protein
MVMSKNIQRTEYSSQAFNSGQKIYSALVGDLSLGGNLSFVGNLDFQWCWKLEILERVASCDIQEAAKDPI